MPAMTSRSVRAILLVGIASACSAFRSCPRASLRDGAVAAPRRRRGVDPLAPLPGAASDAEEYLSANHPSFSSLLSKNGDVAKKVLKSESGFTIFAPNESAFADLGEKRRSQLDDVRNDEVTEKIASYHVIAEPVTSDQLFNSGGVVTEGGEVPAERSVSGGFFGVGGKEDGGVTLNGAKVVKTVEFDDVDDDMKGIVHEVDGFISPSILWRYADQLRIPGSQ